MTLPFHARISYFGIIRLFGPTIYALIATRLHKRDTDLATVAAETINAHVSDGVPEETVEYVRSKILLELQTILYTEYRCVQQPAKGTLH